MEHSTGHSHGPSHYGRAFAIGVTLNLGFVVLEAILGGFAHSLSLLADAAHNFSDVLGLLLAWGAVVLARRSPTPRRTYGLRRSTILASLFNAVLLLVAVGGIIWEAVGRFGNPEPVSSGIVMWAASAGVLVNGFTAWLFMRGRKHDVNIRGAFLHMMADAGVSAGVVLAAFAMRFTGWFWLDPAISLAVAVVITIGTWNLLRESVNLALDAVPSHIVPTEIEAYLLGLPGVVALHDLHIWSMSTTEVALTVHLVRSDLYTDDSFMVSLKKGLHDGFGIEHTTVQIERGSLEHPCDQAPSSVI